MIQVGDTVEMVRGKFGYPAGAIGVVIKTLGDMAFWVRIAGALDEVIELTDQEIEGIG